MKNLLQMLTLTAGMTIAAAAISTAYAGDYCPPEPPAAKKGNNGFGQEKNKGVTGDAAFPVFGVASAGPAR
jgi:hypothetical protein